MEEENTLKDKVDNLNKKFDELLASGKVKGFKIKGQASKSQVKKGYVQVLYIQENGVIRPIKAPIEEGTMSIEGAPRIATGDYMLSYNGKPTLILDSLSSEPYRQKKELDEAVRNSMLAAGYRLLANRVELGAIKAKKKMSTGLIIGIIAALVIGGYFLLR